MKTETQNSTSTAGTKQYVALSCSGASDLGELADRVCRKIRSDIPGTSMNCLAKLGFGEPSLIEKLDKETALVIDGCPIDCGKKIMEKSGITNFKHVRLTDFGYVKGQTPVTKEVIDVASSKIMSVL